MLEEKTLDYVFALGLGLNYAPKNAIEIEAKKKLFQYFFEDNEIFANCFFEHIKISDKFPSHLELIEHEKRAKEIAGCWLEFDVFDEKSKQGFLLDNKHYAQKARALECS